MKQISIIVPIYNVEKYLDKCVMSILGQTFKNFELILIDDGSQDSSGAICDSYLKKDSRIKVIHKKNGGLSSARNEGLKIAKSKYVAFIDSDDWIENNMYEKLYNIAEQNDADIVQCKYVKADDENVKKDIQADGNINFISNIEALENLYNERYIETVVTWNKIYKRLLFENIQFPEGKIHEDEFTVYKILYKAKKIALLDEGLYYYRQNPNSIMNREFNIRRLDILEALNERGKFFELIGNEKLIYENIKKYESDLKAYYFKCEKCIENIDNTLKEIKKIYNSIFFNYIKYKQIQFKYKAMSSIFYISPTVYKTIKKLAKH